MEEYYVFIDNSRVGISYDWTSFNIDLNFNKEDIDLDAIFNGSKSFEGTNKEMLFIHEYVHFLQNFYTNWGGLVFCDFVLGINKIAASRGEDNSKVKLPLKLENKKSGLWNDGIETLQRFQKKLGTDKNNIQLETTNTFPNYTIIDLNHNSVVIGNGRILYTINNKTVREHMAELSACLFANLNDQHIHDKFLTTNAFSSGNSIMDKDPMYWMLFEFFFAKKYKKIAEGLVLLTHTALCSANPVHVICRFFIFLQDNKNNLEDLNLNNLVSAFLKTPSEIISFSYTHYAALKNITDFLKLCKKYEDQSFYQFAQKIYFSLLLNISQTHSCKRFFENPEVLRNKDNWLKMIKSTGTPIIRYKDKKAVITHKNVALVDSLIYFLGIVKVFYNLQTDRNQRCPFFEEFNICNANFKNAEICFHNALEVQNPDDNREDCLYQNAIKLLGLKDRL
ncbi:hypothetical protein [Flavobacterium sp. HNIBRBA15423]|uniref:hypothetical protein n=1 Tax=Flavobacterium sp. HNIBRBA15423 TaxID=3458683 RepID=UPI004044DE96